MDFSITTLFVVPKNVAVVPANGSSTQNLTAGQVGIFTNNYLATVTPSAVPYFYVAQGRQNTYLQGSKRSDKISGANNATSKNKNVTEWYKVTGCSTALNEIWEVSNFSVNCGDTLTLTLRAHSSYIDTLYFNGLTRSVTVQAPCCDCGADPCDIVDAEALVNALIAKLTAQAPSTNPANVSLNNFFTFALVGTGAASILRITGKPLTTYGQPCDVSAFPYEYDRMWFNVFVYSGPATTADFIVADNCDIVANAAITQRSTYVRGAASEIAQLEKNFHSYQAGYMKHLHRLVGYNANFETYVSAGDTYDTFYVKFNDYSKSDGNWGDNIPQDSTVIIAAIAGSAEATAIETVLSNALGAVIDDSSTC